MLADTKAVGGGIAPHQTLFFLRVYFFFEHDSPQNTSNAESYQAETKKIASKITRLESVSFVFRLSRTLAPPSAKLWSENNFNFTFERL